MLYSKYCAGRVRKLQILLLTVVITISMMFGTGNLAFADNQMSGTCGDNASWTLTENTASEGSGGTYQLTITGSGPMYDYEVFSKAGYYWANWEITSVCIENGVTRVGGNAFSYCENLSEVTIPNSVTSIGDEAFYQCSELGSIVIPDSVKSIGGTVFSQCSSLTEIVIPDSIQNIEEYTFAWCSGLVSVTIPDSVASIGKSAFESCTGLTDVYYAGSEDQWNAIAIDNTGNKNDPLMNAAIHYNEKPDTPDDTPDDPDPIENPFTDVQEGNYFYDAVLWAVENNITKGTTDTTFSPSDTCTRGQAVTFLWRANGSEKAAGIENPFSDVQETDYYYDAVLWAVQNGITNGMSETTFEPGSKCTRGQIVTFLWRAEGQPDAGVEAAFEDVGESAYYYKAVQWAVENDVTKGTTETTFSPNDFCTRGRS